VRVRFTFPARHAPRRHIRRRGLTPSCDRGHTRERRALPRPPEPPLPCEFGSPLPIPGGEPRDQIGAGAAPLHGRRSPGAIRAPAPPSAPPKGTANYVAGAPRVTPRAASHAVRDTRRPLGRPSRRKPATTRPRRNTGFEEPARTRWLCSGYHAGAQHPERVLTNDSPNQADHSVNARGCAIPARPRRRDSLDALPLKRVASTRSCGRSLFSEAAPKGSHSAAEANLGRSPDGQNASVPGVDGSLLPAPEVSRARSAVRRALEYARFTRRSQRSRLSEAARTPWWGAQLCSGARCPLPAF
jgi:hypothetical protein